MGTSIQPILYTTEETPGYWHTLATDIKKAMPQDADLLLDYPAVYIHVWRNKYDVMNGRWSIYIGETNNIVQRTKEHWEAGRKSAQELGDDKWQRNMLEDVDEKGNPVVPRVYFIGHKCFHKSLTLDIENRLIDYCVAMPTAHVRNGRANVQGCYAGAEYLDDIFHMIWSRLRKENKELFLPESAIQKSAIFKASPNHKLTKDQIRAKELIIDRTRAAVLKGQTGQLIFVEGEAGTGKTVLTSSTFYEIMDDKAWKESGVTSYMLINHEEQENVYRNIARKLGYGEEIIQNPTTFLKTHSIWTDECALPDPENIVDVVFVDEAHLLWNQNNQAFDSRFREPQLDEIMKRARVTVIMFDENQVLHKGQIFELEYMNQKRNLAKSQGPNPAKEESNYIELKNQLRMNCAEDTMNWIDAFTKDLKINRLSLSKGRDAKGYEVKFFENPKELHEAVKKKAATDEAQLSRLIATFDWEYYNQSQPLPPQKYWEVKIGDWSLPWNEQRFYVDLKTSLNRRQRMRYKDLDWAEKDYSIDEVGSTFTIQGFDLTFAGVILGPSIKYDKQKQRIWFDENKRAAAYMKGRRTLSNGQEINIANMISMHELRVLLTRGTKGLYIYVVDEDLREALKNAVNHCTF